MADKDAQPAQSTVAGIGHCSDTTRSNADDPNRGCYGLPSGELARPGVGGLLFCVVDAPRCDGAEARGSQIAIDRIQQAYYRERTTDRCRALRRAFEAANQEIFERSGGVLFNDLSASVACAVLTSGTLTVAHAGDCRVYLVRSQQLQQLTRDHVKFWGADSDEGDDADQPTSPPLRVLQRSVGSMPTVEIDCNSFELQPDSRVLLCTQGLASALSDDELRATAMTGTPDAAARCLVALAKERGSGEDLTAVVIEPSLLFPTAVAALARAGAAGTFSLLAAGLLVVLLIAAALARDGSGAFRALANSVGPTVTVAPQAETATGVPTAALVAAAETAIASATQQPTDTPTPTESPTPTPSSTPTAAPSETPTEPPTVAPSETPTEPPTPEPTATPLPRPTNPPALSRPSPRPTPPVQLRYTAVRLREPQNDQIVTGASATFEFELQTLQPGDTYVVYYRPAGSTTWNASCPAVKNGTCVLTRAPSLRSGTYEWRVAIIDANGNTVSNPSEIRRIRWSDAAEEPPQSPPGCIPTPTNRC